MSRQIQSQTTDAPPSQAQAISAVAAGKTRQKTKPKGKTMTIGQKELKRALDRLEPWHSADIRKLSNGRLVRFVDWKRSGKAVR